MKLNYSLITLLLIIIGTVAAALISFSALYWLLAGLLFLAVSICLLLYNRGRFGWLVLACFFCSGGFLFSLAREGYLSQLDYNRVFGAKIVTVEGVMVERPVITSKGIQFLFKADPKLKHLPAGKITIYGGPEISGKNWYGHKLRLTGRFNIIKSDRTKFPDYLEMQGITGDIYLTETPELLKGGGLFPPLIWANRCREALSGAGNKVLSLENAKLLHSMIFGDTLGTGGSEGQLLRDLRRTGTIHLLSVSGLHIGFILVTLTFLLGLLKVPKKWRILPIIICTCFYILMTGMEAPVLRAGLMVLIYLIADYIGAADDNLNRLSLAAIILVWLNPYNLFAVGFQLSFLATSGVVWLYPQLKGTFKFKGNFKGVRVLGWIWDGILVSLAAQLMVTPLIVLYFQQISWISPLVNLLILIPGEIIVIGGILGEGVFLFLPWLGRMALTTVDWAISLTRILAHFFGAQPWAASVVPPWPWPWIAGYYLGLIILLTLLRPNLLTGKTKYNLGSVVITLIIVLNLIVWAVFFNNVQEKYLQVSFIDVGQGDAIYIKTPDGSVGLIDGGEENKGNKRVVPFLYKNGISKLDQVFATHYHLDHLAGLTEVLEEVPTRLLYLPSAPPESIPEELDRRFKKLKIKRQTVYSGMKIKLGATVNGEVILATDAVSDNDISQVILLSYGKNKLILTGDLGEEGEAILARKYPGLLRATVLKVGHHGSNEATSLRFLSQVKPKLAVISVGAGNRFGHPGAETLNRLRSLGVTVYRTDLSGTVTLRVYQDRIGVVTTK